MEDESTLKSNHNILTLCKTCNTLISDIDDHVNSGDCQNQAKLHAAERQNLVPNSIVLNVSEEGKVYSLGNVLDDPELNHTIQSGTNAFSYQGYLN